MEVEGGDDMERLQNVAQVCSCLTVIGAALMLFVKPLRERFSGTRHLKDGQKCLLRTNMLHTYYKHREQASMRQYEYENFVYEYKAYKALHGNSFIDRIYEEVKTWEILS